MTGLGYGPMVLDLRWACREGTKTAGHMGVRAHKIPQQVLSRATFGSRRFMVTAGDGAGCFLTLGETLPKPHKPLAWTRSYHWK